MEVISIQRKGSSCHHVCSCHGPTANPELLKTAHFDIMHHLQCFLHCILIYKRKWVAFAFRTPEVSVLYWVLAGKMGGPTLESSQADMTFVSNPPAPCALNPAGGVFLSGVCSPFIRITMGAGLNVGFLAPFNLLNQNLWG